jgi:SAM-dependent methyltransferase
MDLSDPDRWNQRYAEGNTGWDLGTEAHALSELLRDLPARPMRVLVPGAGFGHDAIAWARHGAEVVAVDFAPLAVLGLRERAARAGVRMQAMEADIFALPEAWNESFQVVWEQTCLCAIDPARRGEYVQAMQRMLEPGGTLYALLWNHGREGGPPHDLPEPVARKLFRDHFDVQTVRAVQGSTRTGEYLMTLVRR